VRPGWQSSGCHSLRNLAGASRRAFLDGLPEFKGSVPETMREPLGEGGSRFADKSKSLAFIGSNKSEEYV